MPTRRATPMDGAVVPTGSVEDRDLVTTGTYAINTLDIPKPDANSEWTTDNADAALEQLLSRVRVRDTTNNAVTSPTGLSHILSSGNGATGMGLGLPYLLPSTTGVQRTAGRLDTLWTDATNASEDADLVVMLQRAGTLTEALRVLSTGGVAASSINVADAGGLLAATNAEDALAELAAHPPTIITVGASGCDYTTVAAALAAITDAATTKRYVIAICGYYTDAVAHAMKDYVSLAGSATGQVTLTGDLTVGTVANQCDIRGIGGLSATTLALIKATAAITSDVKPALEASAGIVELATAAEVQTGSDTDRAVTPAGLAAKVIAETRCASFDGGGAIIPAGTYADLYFPYAATITGWSLMAPAAAATCTIGLWSDTWAHYKTGDVPAAGDKITGTAYPTLTADRGQDQSDVAMTDWTLAIAAGTVIRVNIDANTDATRLEFWLRYTRAVA